MLMQHANAAVELRASRSQTTNDRNIFFEIGSVRHLPIRVIFWREKSVTFIALYFSFSSLLGGNEPLVTGRILR